MEVNLNTGQVPGAGSGQPISRRERVQSADTGVSFAGTQSLAKLLNDVPVLRPEKVDHARGLVADVKYPPDELMNGIANLLAVHFNRE